MKRGLRKRWAVIALSVFLAVSLVVVLVHSFGLGYGLKMEMTISKYVGLDYWSAILFFACNTVIVAAWAWYAWLVKEEWGMSKIWFVLAIMAAVFLLLLSLCPIGLFDEVPGQFGWVSVIHRTSAYIMFILMIITDIGLMIKVDSRWFKVVTLIFALYGIAMAIPGALGSTLIWSNALVVESLFLLFYLVILCLIPRKQSEKVTGVV